MMDSDRSTVLRTENGGWTGVPERSYKTEDGTFRGVTRTLVARPEHAAFEVRHFIVRQGGYSSLERHDHGHGVLCTRGRGSVRPGDREHDVGAGDLVYVAPRAVHRCVCRGDQPFGFLCLVDRDRDRPTPLTEVVHALT